MKKIFLLISISYSFFSLSQNNSQKTPLLGKYGGGVTDIDGNKYKTVIIGAQEWMGENLKVTKFNDGTLISNVVDSTAWGKLKKSAWAYNDNDSLNNQKFGKLYNWYVVGEKNKNVCPLGWHVPSDKEWSRLIDSQGDFAFAASKLKSVEKNMWISPEYLTVENVDSKGGKSEDTTKFISQNIENTNSSLFSAIPGGFRFNNGSFMFTGYGAYFWSSEDPKKLGNGVRLLVNDMGSVGGYGSADKNHALSIRCLKD